MTLDEVFSEREDSHRIFDVLSAAIASLGPAEVLVTRSQVAFRRSKAFAWAWVPSKYLGNRGAPLVLTLSFPARSPSPRWKQIVEPAPGRFVHHCELWSEAEVDAEVRGWLQEAWEATV